MTTATDTSPIDHTSTATFQAWGASVKAVLAAAGFVQTADTGQIDWTTVSKPGTNTLAGYEVWRMNDTQQASAPIFFRLSYGTFNVTDRVYITIQFGTGSNGSGTLTGSAAAIGLVQASGGAGTGSFTSYVATGEGYGSAIIKGGSGANFWLSISRSCDSSGTPNAIGWTAVCGGVNSGPYTYFQAVGTGFLTVPTLNAISVVPGGVTSSLVGADYQVFLNWGLNPRMYPLLGSCHAVRSEIAYGVTFSVALIGTTPRTYMATGAGLSGNSLANNANSVYAIAILYE